MSESTATERSIHAEIAELMPLFLCDSLGEIERLKVRVHLNDCLNCRREFAFIQCLREEFRTLDIPRHPAPAGFQRLRSRIEVDESKALTTPMGTLATVPVQHPSSDRRTTRRRAMVSAGAAGAMLVASLIVGAWLLPPPFSMRPLYRTLAAPLAESAAAGDLHVVFHDQVDRAQIDAILKGLRATVVVDRSTDGVYTLRLTPPLASATTSRASAIAAIVSTLRHLPEVALAEATRADSLRSASSASSNEP